MPDAPEAKVRGKVARFGLTTAKTNTPAKSVRRREGAPADGPDGLRRPAPPDPRRADQPSRHRQPRGADPGAQRFPGAVILISHDRHLIEATADRLWLVKDGTVAPYDGDLDDYRQLVTGSTGNSKEKREADKASKADRRREAAARRAAAEPLAKEIRATEALMDRIRKRIDGIEDELANPAVYEKDPSTATRLAKERSQLSAQLSGHEERWLQMSADYEEATAD